MDISSHTQLEQPVGYQKRTKESCKNGMAAVTYISNPASRAFQVFRVLGQKPPDKSHRTKATRTKAMVLTHTQSFSILAQLQSV